MSKFQDWLSDLSLQGHSLLSEPLRRRELKIIMQEVQNNRVSISCGERFPVTNTMLASVSIKYIAIF